MRHDLIQLHLDKYLVLSDISRLFLLFLFRHLYLGYIPTSHIQVVISTLVAVKACKNTRAFELLGFTEACSANVAEVSTNPDAKPNNSLNGIGYVINFSPSEYPEFNEPPVVPETFIPWL